MSDVGVTGRSRTLHGIFFLSGIAGLGYQMVWTRMWTVGLGHEMPSVLAVVAAFFGGLAVGAWLLDRPVSKSPRPVLWYAGLEAIIGVWGLASIALIPLGNELAIQWTGVDPGSTRQWAIAFLMPFIVLLPATVAMGATLPAMERVVSRLHGHARCVGGLYAANTSGAVAGVFISTFVLVPLMGFRWTIAAFAIVNLICAGLVLICARTSVPSSQPLARNETPVVNQLRLAITVFLTGCLGIGYEVLCIRVLGQVTQNTIYSFAGALIAYLLGTALGAAAYQRWLAMRPREIFNSILGALLVALCSTMLLGIYIMRSSPLIDEWLAEVLGDSLALAVCRELIVAAIVFVLPTLLMGATFSHLVQAARNVNGGVGRATAINTLGGALAPVVFGIVLLPAIGAKFAITACAVAYIALIPRFTPSIIMGLGIPMMLVMLAPRDLQIVSLADGSHLRTYRDGVMAAVAVIEDSTGNRFLKVNNRFQMGATVGTFAEKRLGEIPLLLHPDPHSALFLGIGTGVSFGIAAGHPNLAAMGVELIPEAVQLLEEFEPQNNAPTRQPAFKIFCADARRFVRAGDDQFDVIVGDLFHPARDGAAALYTIEHFTAVRNRLAPGGLFCQWLPMYQLDEPTLRVIVRTFLEVFPHTRAFIGHYNVGTPMLGLIGSLDRRQYSFDYLETRVSDERLKLQLEELALTNSFQLFGCLLMDENELETYSEAALVNTDDHPIVLFSAPRFAYLSTSNGYGRLEPFINHVSKGIDSLVPSDGTDDGVDAFQRELYDYIAARNVYLHGMIAAAEGHQDETLKACIQSARMSSHFMTGYVQALEAARQTASTNRRLSLDTLNQLIEARPDIPDARELRQRLFHQ